MKLKISNLKELLPNLDWSADTLVERLSLIGYESELLDEDEIEIDITPNRGDSASLLGLARELSAIYQLDFNDYQYADLPPRDDFVSLKIDNSIANDVLSDFLIKITDCHNLASPVEVSSLVKEYGFQSKGLLVDLTNIVTFQIGSPLHAFDAEYIDQIIEIRPAKSNERINLVASHDEQILNSKIVIQSSKDKIIDLIGVMGGLDSSVSDQTKNVIVQAGVFTPALVRQNIINTNIRSHASDIYLKGVSDFTAELGLKRFIYLLKKYQPTVSIAGASYYNYSTQLGPKKINLLTYSKVLGYQVSLETVKKLTKLGFTVSETEITIPKWRTDFNLDSFDYEIAREIFRLNQSQILPVMLESNPKKRNHNFTLRQSLKERLTDIGFTETLTDSLADSGTVKILNPISTVKPYLRSTLKDGLLKTVGTNPFIKNFSYFELGIVFNDSEQLMLGLITSDRPKEDAKINSMIDDLSWEEVDTKTKELFEIKSPKIYFTEINFKEIDPAKVLVDDFCTNLKQIKPISRFAPSNRDISILVNKDQLISEVIDIIQDHPNILFAELLDEYTSEKFKSDTKSISLRVIFQKLDRSLTNEEVTELLQSRFQELKKRVEFEIR